MLAGSPDTWLRHFRDLEEQVIAAVEAAWPVCMGPLQARKNAMSHEDHITEHLVHALIRSKALPGRIIYQYTLLSVDPAGNVRMSSNIDFVLTIGDDEDVYLACECKRLNVPYKSSTRGLVGEYVDDGVMRFVSGQYSNGLPLALMLGYVMNARVDRARHGLRRAMAVRSATLGLTFEHDRRVEGGRPLRFHTTHTCVSGHTIEVAHALLSWT